MKRHELTEEQWNKVKELLPPEEPAHGGRPGKDNRVMLNGILYWLNTGIPWRDLPEQHGPGRRADVCRERGSNPFPLALTLCQVS